METNAEVYSSEQVLRHYATYSDTLQLPESAILALLQQRLSAMRMLDIGVGGGRTTAHFAPLVRTYTAIDFSEGMIASCKEKYQTELPAAKFAVCDVRDLSRFEARAFEFVLFSFNGIDNVSAPERRIVLAEIRRICAPGGIFCFSSHNLQYLPAVFKLHLNVHPVRFIRSLIERRSLLRNNRQQINHLASANQLVIYDNVFDFGLYTCYVRPEWQVKQLLEVGFDSVKLFGLYNGNEINVKDYSKSTDPWIYYFCTS